MYRVCRESFPKLNLTNPRCKQNRKNSFNSNLNIMLNSLESLYYYRNLNACNIVGIPNFDTKIFGKKSVRNIIVKISAVKFALNFVLSF